VEFAVLGPLDVTYQGRSLTVGTPRDRTVLAVLLARANDLVAVDVLVDELWPRQPPPQARTLVHGYVSRIRRALRAGPAGPAVADRLITHKPGYLIRVEHGELDLHRFEQFVADGRGALRAGRPEEALTSFRRAQELWRGTPFADLPATPIISGTATRLAELRLAALEELYETALALGQNAGMVAELTALTSEHPLRERLVGQLMLALHSGGRTADALAAYQDIHRRLADNLGIDPGAQLQRLRLAILRNDPDVVAGPAGPAPRPAPADDVPVPRQLPGDLSTFAGRGAELERLLDLAAAVGSSEAAVLNGNGRSPALVIEAIDGMAGVGKTALAIRAAHRLASRFPDGQLFIDLHGFTQRVPPVDPADALDQMLHGIGVPGEQIPLQLDARSALYRTRLADRRMLIVLDNALDENQVRPLLPGSPGCLVLITSRHRLAGLDNARALSLDVLPLDDALDLFTRITGADPTSEAVVEIVRLCGRLPLAIRIAAARLGARPSWTDAHLAERLRDRRHRLTELHSGPRSVTAAIDLSYRQLTAAQRHMYRLLGLQPGPDIEAHAAAALAGITERTASGLLDDLAAVHLLGEPSPGRYRFHDLLRAHAAQSAGDEDPEDDRHAALTRLLDHYTHTAAVAMGVVYPNEALYLPPTRRPATPTPAFAAPKEAAAWLDTELTNLLAAAAYSAGHGLPDYTVHVSGTLRRYLHLRGRYTQLIDLLSLALATARDSGHRLGELDALCGLGEAHRFQGRLEQAADCFERALRIARDIGHRQGELDVLRRLGNYHRSQGRLDEAADCLEQALRIARDMGNDVAELTVLGGLGYLRRSQGRLEPAADCFERALSTARDMGDRQGELIALHGLGEVRRAQERYAAAGAGLEQALAIALEIGNPNYEFETRHSLGLTCRATGHPADAIAHHQAALGLARDLRQLPDQARALHGLATAYHDLDQCEEARAHWQHALDILTDLGAEHAEEISADQIRVHLDGLLRRRSGSTL
jgi:DNA-binding SARP family transcriptional activator/Tfp pilus assembly protein PilF